MVGEHRTGVRMSWNAMNKAKIGLQKVIPKSPENHGWNQ
jgi:hypothetical protein